MAAVARSSCRCCGRATSWSRRRRLPGGPHLADELPRRGGGGALVPTTPRRPRGIDGARWSAESPSNPGLDVDDLALDEARTRRAPLVVDNTLATPLGQRPLELGADFSVTGDTKY